MSIAKYVGANCVITVPIEPEAAITPERIEVATAKLTKGGPGICKINSLTILNVGAFVKTIPNATALAATKEDPMDPIAPAFKTSI